MPGRDNYNRYLEKISGLRQNQGLPEIDLEALFESIPSSLISGDIQLTYLKDKPAKLENGMIWMESNGLHLYYNGVEKSVAGT